MRNKKTVVIHQPDFMPYLGFFHRLLHCDVFVVLDHVQLLKRGWHHRDKIKGPNGAHWLTVPIKRDTMNPAINEARIDDSRDWVSKHLETISHFYKKSKYFNEIFCRIKAIYEQNHMLLVDFNLSFLQFFCDLFSIDVPVVFSSSLQIESNRSRLILDIVKAVDGTLYLSGKGARDYLDTSLFDKESIEVEWQEFDHPVYPQLHGEFIPFMSSLDFAMNCGPSLCDYVK